MSKPKKGYQNDAEKANDCYVALIELLFEVNSARVFFHHGTSHLKRVEKKANRTKADVILGSTMRRLAIWTVASTMYKYAELYECFLSRFRFKTPEAKKLYRIVPEFKLRTLRMIAQHAVDDATGRIHDPDKINEAFEKASRVLSPSFDEGVRRLGLSLEAISTELRQRFPDLESAMDRRYSKIKHR